MCSGHSARAQSNDGYRCELSRITKTGCRQSALTCTPSIDGPVSSDSRRSFPGTVFTVPGTKPSSAHPAARGHQRQVSGGTAVIQRGRPQVAPPTRGRMSAARRAELTLSTRNGHQEAALSWRERDTHETAAMPYLTSCSRTKRCESFCIPLNFGARYADEAGQLPMRLQWRYRQPYPAFAG